jgi:hypothetical protein
MSEKKYIVPAGMLDATFSHAPMVTCKASMRDALEAALRWWSKNPTVPTTDQAMEIGKKFSNQPSVCDYVMQVCVEWQRRCFLAPEPEVPEEIKDLLYSECEQRHERIGCSDPKEAGRFITESDRRVLEAYRRGQESGKE